MGDRINEAYNGTFGRDFQTDTRERIFWVCQQVKGERVLDVGCSQGIVDLLLAREGYDVCGIDLDEAAVAYGKTELAKETPGIQERVQFLIGDYLAYRPDHPFDTIIMTEVLEHLTQPKRFLENALTMLNKDGILIVTLPFGLNVYPDHKQTYYLIEAYQMLDEVLSVSVITFWDQWIGFVCRNSVAPSIKLTDDLFIQADIHLRQKEMRYSNKITQLQEKERVQTEKLVTCEQTIMDFKKAEADHTRMLAAEKQKLEQSIAQLQDLEDKHQKLGLTLKNERESFSRLQKEYDALQKEHRSSKENLSGQLFTLSRMEEALKQVQLNVSNTEAKADRQLSDIKALHSRQLAELTEKNQRLRKELQKNTLPAVWYTMAFSRVGRIMVKLFKLYHRMTSPLLRLVKK